MNISQKGIDLIKKYEGLRLEAYLCPAGVWTIGYGHIAGVKKGMKITAEQAEEYLKSDLAKFEKLVMRYDYKYHWNQNEFDALMSFALNNGSIGPLTKYGSRSRKTIAKKILEYNKAKNSEGKLVVLNGLVKRRKEEQALFLKPMETEGQIEATEDHSTITGYYGKENSNRPVLQLGSKGEEVKEVQKFLAGKDIYHGSIDGIFGPITQQAVIEWQGYCEIVKDGIVGKCTWATMG